jgi:histidinol-phosphatase
VVVDDLELALELAEIADQLTMSRYGAGDLVVETKPDLTPVTDADRAVEEAITEQLASARPRDAIVGEELGESLTGDGARRWIVDPIDGTKNYMRGIPIWATLLALADGPEIVLGVASAPRLRRRWWAVRGAGAFASDGCRLSVSRVARLDDAQLLWGGIEEWEVAGGSDAVRDLARRCWRDRGLGDFWQYMLVAEGAAEIALDPIVSLWDLAAPQVIVEEAGGRFSDFFGARRADGGSALATNGLLHDVALEIVGR